MTGEALNHAERNRVLLDPVIRVLLTRQCNKRYCPHVYLNNRHPSHASDAVDDRLRGDVLIAVGDAYVRAEVDTVRSAGFTEYVLSGGD